MSLIIKRRAAQNELHLADISNPVLRRVLHARPVTSSDDLELPIKGLLSPDRLLGMETGITLLVKHLHAGTRILIVADFDADGATSCALSILALTAMGFRHVDYIVPNRFEYGYGLTPEIVELARSKKPDLIITVDNGISSIEGVDAARSYGIEVMITDHHLPGARVPEADAIVNPNQPGCEFESKNLAGVGVIFYVMLALRARLRDLGWFAEQHITEPNLASLLDLVALGTVADVVPLDRNNRILVKEGLRRIRGGQARPGIKALIQVGKRNAQRLGEADLGFAVGPRLNAAGRLEDMSLGIECLLSESAADAYSMALELDALNSDRKQIEQQMQIDALAALGEVELDADDLPAVICLYSENWHQGVVGILASRIKEKFHRPVIAFADEGDEAGAQIKGSARSITGFHIRDALDVVASRHPGLINKFGGHAMAAGLSIARDKLESFRNSLTDYATSQLGSEQLQARVLTDGAVAEEEFNLDTARILVQAGPWGQGFPEPTFDGEFQLQEVRIVAELHYKLTVLPAGGDKTLDAIAFNLVNEVDLEPGMSVRLVYRMGVNEFRGCESLQLTVEHVQVLSEASRR